MMQKLDLHEKTLPGSYRTHPCHQEGDLRNTLSVSKRDLYFVIFTYLFFNQNRSISSSDLPAVSGINFHTISI